MRKGFWLLPVAIVGPVDHDALPSAAETAAELARLRDLGGAATHSEVAQFVAAECRMAQYALAEALEQLDRGKRLTATMYLRLLAEYGLRLSWLCGEDEVVDELGRLVADPELANARVRELRHRDLDQVARTYDAVHQGEAEATLGGELRGMASELGDVLAPGQIAQLGTTRFGQSLYRGHRTASTHIHAGAVLSSGPEANRLPLEAMLAEAGFICAAVIDALLRAAALDTGPPFPRRNRPRPG